MFAKKINMNNKGLITIELYAKMCGVSITTIYNRIAANKILPVKKGSAIFVNLDTTPILLKEKSGRKSAKSILNEK